MQSAVFCRRNRRFCVAWWSTVLHVHRDINIQKSLVSSVYFIQYFSVLSWVTSLVWQVSKVLTVLCPIAKANLPRLTKAENWDVFYEPPSKLKFWLVDCLIDWLIDWCDSSFLLTGDWLFRFCNGKWFQVVCLNLHFIFWKLTRKKYGIITRLPAFWI